MFNSKTQFFISPSEADLDQTASDIFTFKTRHPMVIHSVEFFMTEATDAAIATASVVSFDYKIGSGSRTEHSTKTVAVSLAIGDTIKLVDANGAFIPLDLKAGDTLYLEHKTAQTSGEAGKGRFIVFYEMGQDVEVA